MQRNIKEVFQKFPNNAEKFKKLLEKYHLMMDLTKKADQIFGCEQEYTCFRLPDGFAGYALVTPAGYPTRRAIFFADFRHLETLVDEILNFSEHGVNAVILDGELKKCKNNDNDHFRLDGGLVLHFPSFGRRNSLHCFDGVPRRFSSFEICPFDGEFLHLLKNDAGVFPCHSDLSEEFQLEIECLNYDFACLTSKAFFDLLP